MLVISKRPGGSTLIISERDLEGLGAGSQPGGQRCVTLLGWRPVRS